MSVDTRGDKTEGFYFERPEMVDGLSTPANLAIAIGAIASRLVREERTRTNHPDGRLENVAEHSLMLVKVAVALAQEFYPDLDAGKVAIAAANHDDVEAYVGDTPTDRINGNDLTSKAEREAIGLHQLTKEYGDLAPTYVKAVGQYEAQTDPHDRFVRVVDKLMTLLIHLPNDGQSIKDNYPKDEFIRLTEEAHQRLITEYPDFAELVELRRELAYHLAELYY
ncbi:MAG TPA: HD domain-containing protein [Candidatus Saccharimonadales bacterium]|nr:HD domain-containing protein [Candidatus Saccharimonadales bacterium]